jgi:hypothetical protein
MYSPLSPKKQPGESVNPDDQLRYTRGRQGVRWPQSGCPNGFLGSSEASARCTDWSAPAATPETAPVYSVCALGVGGRMYVTYKQYGRDAIQLQIAEGVDDETGRLIFWRPKQTIPSSQSIEAPALGLLYESGFRDRVIRLLVAVWPNHQTRRLEAAHVDLANSPTTFTRRAEPQDSLGAPIATNGGPATLTFWGRDDGGAVGVNQTWMALPGADSLIRIYRYDPATTRWQDATSSVFPDRPTGQVKQQIAFLAYADGVFDLDFRVGSDFRVMERGICLRLLRTRAKVRGDGHGGIAVEHAGPNRSQGNERNSLPPKRCRRSL